MQEAGPSLKETRQDDFVTSVTGMRSLMNQQSANDLIAGHVPLIRYATGGLYARIVDMPADKAVDRGVIIEGDADGQIANEYDRLNVLHNMADALRWAALTGGAGIVMLTQDGGSLQDELSETGLREIVELRTYCGTDFKPEPARYEDPTKANFGMPIRYRVTSNGVSFVVHESRILTVTGGPLPNAVNISNVPWMGRVEITRAYKSICRYEESLDYALKILMRKQQGVYGMTGMADLLKNPAIAGVPGSGERIIQSRINAVDAVRGVLNTVAVDGADSYTIIDSNLGGIKDVIGEMKSAVSADSGIAITIAFGESPGGLQATGESDFQGWFEKVEGLQKRLQKPLERLTALIQLQNKIKPLNEWRVVWPPLESPNEKEEAEIENKRADTRKKDVEAVKAAVDSAILTEQQAAEVLVEIGHYKINGLEPQGSRTSAVTYAQQT